MGSGGRTKAKKQGSLAETTRFLILLFLAALILRSLIVTPFSIPSGSMLPRLMIGDYLFVSKWPYGYSRFSFPFGIASFEGRIWGAMPQRGDVAVFRCPASGGADCVKRVIGLPGDRVQMRGGDLVLNGKVVPRIRIADYLMPASPNSPCRFANPERSRVVADAAGRKSCAFPRYRETLPGGRSYDIIDQAETPGDDTETFTVPEGHLFLLGDNRDDSLDSRFPQSIGGVGFLPADHLIGRALITFFSTNGSAEWLKPWTWVSAARWDRIGGTF